MTRMDVVPGKGFFPPRVSFFAISMAKAAFAVKSGIVLQKLVNILFKSPKQQKHAKRYFAVFYAPNE